MQVKWSIFKEFVDSKTLSIQWVDLGQRYSMKAFDGIFSLECEVHKELEPENNTDFETNFKANGNKKLEYKDNTGRISVSPSFEDSQGLSTAWKGHLYVAQPNSLNIYDEQISTQLKLRGGWYNTFTASTLGDYVEFSIVDKDNVLGLFSLFGLTVGQGVLELKKFVKTAYVNPNLGNRKEFISAGASEIMAGLYFRVYYYNSGSSSVTFSVTEKYHET